LPKKSQAKKKHF